MYDFEAPLKITNNTTGAHDLILIDFESSESSDHRGTQDSTIGTILRYPKDYLVTTISLLPRGSHYIIISTNPVLVIILSLLVTRILSLVLLSS